MGYLFGFIIAIFDTIMINTMVKKEATMYYVYILSCADDTLYTGITKELDRRINEHNTSPKGAKYTKARRPVTLVYHEECEDRSAASKREYAIKKMSRREKQRLCDK